MPPGPLNRRILSLGRITVLGYDRGARRDSIDAKRFYVRAGARFGWRHPTQTFLPQLFPARRGIRRWSWLSAGLRRRAPEPGLARFPRTRIWGDTKYDRFDTVTNTAPATNRYHTFNDNWQFKQNLMYFSDITDILQVYGAGLVTNADGAPTDYRTVDRDNFPFRTRTFMPSRRTRVSPENSVRRCHPECADQPRFSSLHR